MYVPYITLWGAYHQYNVSLCGVGNVQWVPYLPSMRHSWKLYISLQTWLRQNATDYLVSSNDRHNCQRFSLAVVRNLFKGWHFLTISDYKLWTHFEKNLVQCYGICPGQKYNFRPKVTCIIYYHKLTWKIRPPTYSIIRTQGVYLTNVPTICVFLSMLECASAIDAWHKLYLK